MAAKLTGSRNNCQTIEKKQIIPSEKTQGKEIKCNEKLKNFKQFSQSLVAVSDSWPPEVLPAQLSPISHTFIYNDTENKDRKQFGSNFQL